MSREIYLLGAYEHPAKQNMDQLREMINRLPTLGIGERGDAQTRIFRPKYEGYIDPAAMIAKAVKAREIIVADFFGTWRVPLTNQVQVAASIAGTLASAMRDQGIQRSQQEQSLMIVQPGVYEEFVKHNIGEPYYELTQQAVEQHHPIFTITKYFGLGQI